MIRVLKAFETVDSNITHLQLLLAVMKTFTVRVLTAFETVDSNITHLQLFLAVMKTFILIPGSNGMQL